MSNRQSGNTVRIESWKIRQGGKSVKVEKIATRAKNGQFHGSTNFRGTVLSK